MMPDTIWRKPYELSPPRAAASRRSGRPTRRRYRPGLDPLEERWTPAVFTVTTPADNAPGPAVSLREAIRMANQTPGPDTIDFAANLAGQKINLTQGQLRITDDLVLNGPGQLITVDANDQSRIFRVDRDAGPNITVQINNLRLVDGRAEGGGAIHNEEHLTLNTVILASNVSTGGPFDGGGAIFNRGGDLTLQNCSLRKNRGEEGGALRNRDGQVRIINTSLANNTASSGGALVSRGGRVTLDRANLASNKSSGSGGGAVVRNTELVVTDTTLTHNEGGSFGGAIIAYNSTLEFVGTTLANNRGRSGSAIDVNDSTLTLTNSTVADNAGAPFFSGAIDATGGGVTLRNATVAGTRDSSGIRIKSGATLTLSNSVVAQTASGFRTRDVDNEGTLILQGKNLVEDGSVAGAGVLTGAPRLGPLASNGGPTMTFLPQAGSPVIDAGDITQAPPNPFDQRGPGFERVEGGTIDLGAVEVQV